MKTSPQTLTAGREVVVETVFGTYRGVLAQSHTTGSDVRIRCVGHDIWLHRRSVNVVRAA